MKTTLKVLLCKYVSFALLFASLFSAPLIHTMAQNTYIWKGADGLGGDGNWTTSSHWSPSRNSASGTDNLLFNQGGIPVIVVGSSPTGGRIKVSNATEVTLNTSDALNDRILMIGYIAGDDDLFIAAGSKLHVGNRIVLRLSATNGLTASIQGTLSIGNTSTSIFDLNTAASVTTITGLLVNANRVDNTSTSRLIFDGGTYQHARNAGTIPLATWNVGSTCEITGCTDNVVAPGDLFLSDFYHFKWNCENQSVSISLNGNLKTVNGDFVLASSNGYQLSLTTDSPLNLIIGGNLYIQSGTLVAVDGNPNPAPVFSIRGNLTNDDTFIPGGIGTFAFTGNNNSLIAGSSTTTFYNLSINKDNVSTLVTCSSGSKAFTVNNDLVVSRGTLVLQAVDDNYVIENDLNIGSDGTLNHDVNWSNTGKLLRVNGNVSIDGMYTSSTEPHLQMGGSNKTIRTGQPPSALKRLTLVHPGGTTITANGLVTVDGIFSIGYMFTGAGTFLTSSNIVDVNNNMIVSGGSINISGGVLNVLGALIIGVFNGGSLELSSGTLNASQLSLGDGQNSTLTHSGGTVNILNSLEIWNSGSYTCSGSPEIRVGGNFRNNKTFNPANSTVKFNGTGAQTIQGTSGLSFYNLSFANSSAAVSLQKSCSIGNEFSILPGSKANLGTFTHYTEKLYLGTGGTMNGSWGHSISDATYKNDVFFNSAIGKINVTLNSCDLSFSAEGTDISCYGGTDGEITVHILTGQPPYAFRYSNDGGATWLGSSNPDGWIGFSSGNTHKITGLSAKTYLVHVKDGNGCVQTECTIVP